MWGLCCGLVTGYELPRAFWENEFPSLSLLILSVIEERMIAQLTYPSTISICNLQQSLSLINFGFDKNFPVHATQL